MIAKESLTPAAVRRFRSLAAVSAWGGRALAAILAMAGASLSVQASEKTVLHPYRAAYALSSVPAGTGMVSQVSGIALEEWLPGCDGAISNRETSLTIVLEDGNSIETNSRVSKWESADGSRMRFFTTERRSSEEVEAIGGNARREGAQVIVQYTHPEPLTRTLPGKTIFPWQHLKRLQQAVDSGERFDSSSVFSGENLENDPLLFVFRILEPVPVSNLDLSAVKGRDDQFPATAWRYSAAAFAGTDDPLPQFETAGVGTLEGFIIDDQWRDGDVAVNTSLRSIEMLPPVTCP